MYIDSIAMRNFRTFKRARIGFLHADGPSTRELGNPAFANMNLVLGGNGSGKTTLLKGIAIAALGPAVTGSGLFPYHLVRREYGRPVERGAFIEATFTPNDQDRNSQLPDSIEQVESSIRIGWRGDLEQFEWVHPDDKRWHPIFSSSSDAFFFVGYGATRRVEKVGRVDEAGRRASSFVRAGRITSLFEEQYSLMPLSHWLPRFQAANRGRFVQARSLVNRLLGPGRYQLTDEMSAGEYIFKHGRARVPFPALSDGYRALIGWIGDLLYHICETCPRGKKLDENQGIVMVDEVDLHIHPEWQMQLLPRLAKYLPKIQFIVTSHSPLLVGSLEWRNVIVARQRKDGSGVLEQVEVGISKMDADQILLTELFGLQTTRSGTQTRRIRELIERTRVGDGDAARELMAELSGTAS